MSNQAHKTGKTGKGSVPYFLTRYRVFLESLFGLFYFLFARPTGFTLAVGISISVLGEAVRIWAAGHIEKGTTLTVTGPYALTRNPLYLGSFMIALGLAVACSVMWLAVSVILFQILITYFVVLKERRLLAQRFPVQYDAYAHRVPLFFPRFRGLDASAGRFSWQRILKNREYRAAAGVLAAAILLILKARYFVS